MRDAGEVGKVLYAVLGIFDELADGDEDVEDKIRQQLPFVLDGRDKITRALDQAAQAGGPCEEPPSRVPGCMLTSPSRPPIRRRGL